MELRSAGFQSPATFLHSEVVKPLVVLRVGCRKKSKTGTLGGDLFVVLYPEDFYSL